MYYTKLTGAESIIAFFQKLPTGSRLLVKGERGQSHRFIYKDRKNRLIQLESSNKSNPPFFLKEKLVINIQIDQDQYSFESELFAMDRQVFIMLPDSIQHFQKRRHQRLDTSILKSNRVIITRIDSAPCVLELGLMDFSLGGCALQNRQSNFRLRKDDEVEGIIFLETGESYNFQASVKCERRETHGYVFGLEFDLSALTLHPRGFLAVLETQVQDYLAA